jgi:hypothetical protein
MMWVRMGNGGGENVTCAVTSSSFAHDDVAGAVVDDHAYADEGTGEVDHSELGSGLMVGLGDALVS